MNFECLGLFLVGNTLFCLPMMARLMVKLILEIIANLSGELKKMIA